MTVTTTFIPNPDKPYAGKWMDCTSENDNSLFYFVQMAGFNEAMETKTHYITWPLLRESQSTALELPNTSMATTIDLGNQKSVHPKVIILVKRAIKKFQTS